MSPTITNETRQRLIPNLFCSRPRRQRSWPGLLLLCWTGTAIAAGVSFALTTWFLHTFIR
ncbi:MAG: hypothetical protein WCP45_15205 [Verrucomicrobiota bacterium]